MPDGRDGHGGLALQGDNRLRDAVYGVALMLMLGWILFIGRAVFVPMVSAILVVYVVAGVARLTLRVPYVGRVVPIRLHYLFAGVVISYGLLELVGAITANLTALVARAPEFQTSLLVLVQGLAERFGVEDTLSWEAIRRDLLGTINLQTIARTGISSAASMLTALFIVLLNVGFLMMEQRSFYDKLSRLSSDPAKVRRLLAVVTDINDRVGRYLALKTLINVVLGVMSYAIMWLMGLEFAGFWAILIAALNYIPYIGSFIAVAFPVALAIVQFGDINDVLVLLIALILAQMLMGNIVEPQVMGQSLNLSPYVILVSLTVWSSLWGVFGAFVAVPIMAVLVIVLSEFEGSRPLAVLLSLDGDLPPRSED